MVKENLEIKVCFLLFFRVFFTKFGENKLWGHDQLVEQSLISKTPKNQFSITVVLFLGLHKITNATKVVVSSQGVL